MGKTNQDPVGVLKGQMGQMGRGSIFCKRLSYFFSSFFLPPFFLLFFLQFFFLPSIKKIINIIVISKFKYLTINATIERVGYTRVGLPRWTDLMPGKSMLAFHEN